MDSPELNVLSRLKEMRQEPVIAVPIPKNNFPRKTKNRQIINFDDNEPNTSLASSSSGSVPKSLSDLCLRIDQRPKTHAEPSRMDQSIIEPSTITSLPIQPESPSSIKMYEPSSTAAPIQFNYQHEYSEDIETPQSDSGMADDNFKVTSDSSTSTSTSNVPSKHTSLNSSVSSIKSIEDVADIKARLRETIDRCAMLENRIAELSL